MITELQAELEKALAFETTRITGYEEFMAMPDYLMNGTAKSEIQEALTWSLNRRELLNSGISALGALIEDGFPSRLQQVAPEDIVQVFLDRLANLTAAVGEFTTLTATLTNDGEHPVVE